MKQIICERCQKIGFRATCNALYCLDCLEEVNKEGGRKRYKEKFRLFSNKCYFCERKRSLEIHHIDKNGKNNKKENLICLCILCHKKLHSKIYKKIWRS